MNETDRILVLREDLILNEDYSHISFLDTMALFRGHCMLLESKRGPTSYIFKDFIFIWGADMFRDPTEEDLRKGITLKRGFRQAIEERSRRTR